MHPHTCIDSPTWPVIWRGLSAVAHGPYKKTTDYGRRLEWALTKCARTVDDLAVFLGIGAVQARRYLKGRPVPAVNWPELQDCLTRVDGIQVSLHWLVTDEPPELVPVPTTELELQQVKRRNQDAEAWQQFEQHPLAQLLNPGELTRLKQYDVVRAGYYRPSIDALVAIALSFLQNRAQLQATNERFRP